MTALLFSMRTPGGAAAGQAWVSCVDALAQLQLPEYRAEVAEPPA